MVTRPLGHLSVIYVPFICHLLCFCTWEGVGSSSLPETRFFFCPFFAFSGGLLAWCTGFWLVSLVFAVLFESRLAVSPMSLAVDFDVHRAITTHPGD